MWFVAPGFLKLEVLDTGRLYGLEVLCNGLCKEAFGCKAIKQMTG